MINCLQNYKMPESSGPYGVGDVVDVLSPTYSECDSVCGLIENGNTRFLPNTPKTRKIDALNQVGQLACN